MVDEITQAQHMNEQSDGLDRGFGVLKISQKDRETKSMIDFQKEQSELGWTIGEKRMIPWS